MPGLKLVYAAATGEFAAALAAMQGPIASAATGAIRDMGEQLKRDARGIIAAAGFSAKWQNAYQLLYFPRKESINAAAYAYHKIGYSGIFARGGKIAGSPYLWLPLAGVPERVGGRRMSPGVFEALIGPLHTVGGRAGKPPLLAAYIRGKPGARLTLPRLRAGSALARLGVRQARGAYGTLGVRSVPVFIGLRAVQLKKRFDLRPALDRAKAGLPAAYLKHLRQRT